VRAATLGDNLGRGQRCLRGRAPASCRWLRLWRTARFLARDTRYKLTDALAIISAFAARASSYAANSHAAAHANKNNNNPPGSSYAGARASSPPANSHAAARVSRYVAGCVRYVPPRL